MSSHGTPTQQLADVLLGGKLEEFVRSRRPHRSWRLIARDLYEATDGRIDLAFVTIRGWYPDQASAEATDEETDGNNVEPLARSA